MNINDLAKKHNFKKDVDYWQHKQSGQWILKHDAITKIANAENIKLIKIESLYQSDICVRFLVTMGLLVDNKFVSQIISVGEADTNNCFLSYLGCVAEKRGIDRCVLKLINAYEYGISSEEEADDFKQVEKPKPSKPIKLEELVVDVEKTPEPTNGVVVVDDMEIVFGRNKGKMVSECDKGYQKWLSTSELDFKTFKNPDGSLKVDEIKKLNDCAKYFLSVKQGEESVTF